MKELTNDYLEEAIEDSRPYAASGKVNLSLPGYDETIKDDLRVSIITTNGSCFSAGNNNRYIPMQSTSKIIGLMLALQDFGKNRVFQTVGMEPMGDFFNSISQLESYDTSKPFNPMINAGAIAVSALIKGKNVENRFNRYMDFLRKITNNDHLKMSKEVYEAEKSNGARNRSLAYFMQSTGTLVADAEEALDLYFRMNSVMMCCHDFARVGLFLAKGGLDLETDEKLIPSHHLRTVKAIMMSSGMYNSSGHYAVEAGFPCKSGVSGSIIGSIPGRMGIGVIGPAIDEKGNSTAGGALIKKLSQDLELNMFGVDYTDRRRADGVG
ncbi:L-glutaminase [Halobacillus karajensis]|uniref:Glutaminase n=1 Tax=Halobacillus karajensis TaxID=195088 RepID=A0A024P8Y0_9BACI|nr:glutaminase A [Halobacillus karajensis]CDQ21460.1 Glutaminase 2 [Halobacillus karajensis]CDQ25395.1 Glutaminase 2 [Halobacillus karajensis]CDQ29719.1 Glutaminase 2 [Halobacillus karajensis]SEI07885.1 L-glutaminase [Halobacillus karajensis]